MKKRRLLARDDRRGDDRKQLVVAELYYVFDGDEDGTQEEGESNDSDRGTRNNVLERAWASSQVPTEPMERMEFIRNVKVILPLDEIFAKGFHVVRNKAPVVGSEWLIKKPGVESPVGRILWEEKV